MDPKAQKQILEKAPEKAPAKDKPEVEVEREEPKPKSTGFYEQEMMKMNDKKPEYSSDDSGSFFGDGESFNFEEDENDDFFGAVKSFGETERPNFEPNFSPKNERGFFAEGRPRNKESFNFQENDDEGFFRGIEKEFGADADDVAGGEPRRLPGLTFSEILS